MNVRPLVAIACFLLPWLLVCASPLLATPVSAPIPLESWIYPALEKLEGMSGQDGGQRGFRVMSRHEAARRLSVSRETLPSTGASPVAADLLRLLERELQEELRILEGGEAPGREFQPLLEPHLGYVFREGEVSNYPGTNARQFALNTNHDGIDYRQQHNLEFGWESRLSLGDILLLDWRPRLELREGAGTRLRTTTGGIAVAAGPVTFSAGRQSLWWGQGQHGSLVLTNNAQPLDMLRAHTPSPVELPSFLSLLGPFQFDLFFSRLEEEREVPEPYFTGLRLGIRPTGWLEVGASRTIMFGGEGRPGVDVGDFLTILTGKNLSGDDDNSNSIAALDARLRFASLWGLQLYGELGGEDEANHFFSKTAYLAGAYLPQVAPGGRFDLRVEYADTSPTDGGTPVWYRHSIYRSGYTYEQKILGHHAGGDARDLWVATQLFLPRELHLTLSCDYEQRGINQPLREKHYQPGLGLRWLGGNGSLGLQYSYAHVKNADFADGTADRHYARLEYTCRW